MKNNRKGSNYRRPRNVNRIRIRINSKVGLLIFVIILLISVGGFFYMQFTAIPSLQSVIENASFDTSEVTLDVSLKNVNDELSYTYVVSDSNNYIKSVKKQNSITETSIVYNTNNTYYLYVNKGTPTNIELTDTDGANFIKNLKTEVNSLEDYLDINFDIVKSYNYSKELITFSVYKDSVYYDYEIVIEDDKLVNLKQVFTANNSINTVDIAVSYEVNIDIPSV